MTKLSILEWNVNQRGGYGVYGSFGGQRLLMLHLSAHDRE